jgi:hypothetical protein
VSAGQPRSIACERGKVGEHCPEAMDGQTIVGVLGLGFALATGEGWALATGDERKASPAARSWLSNSMGASA